MQTAVGSLAYQEVIVDHCTAPSLHCCLASPIAPLPPSVGGLCQFLVSPIRSVSYFLPMSGLQAVQQWMLGIDVNGKLGYSVAE